MSSLPHRKMKLDHSVLDSCRNLHKTVCVMKYLVTILQKNCVQVITKSVGMYKCHNADFQK